LLEGAGAASTGNNLFTDAMAALRVASREAHDRRLEELAYVTQVLVAGCTFESRAMRALEAARAAIATISLGIDFLLEDLLQDATAVTVIRRESVDKLFRVGWHLLFRDIVMPAARALEQQLRTSSAPDQARALGAAIKSGKPWSALPGVRTLDMDRGEIKTLLALSDECPTLRDLLAQTHGRTQEIAFVARCSQLQAVGDFLATRGVQSGER
jgi:hypothetical protein